MKEELIDYGLSDKETRVYLALSELGLVTVNQIAEKADLIRTTTYDVLKVLREKGLVSSVIKNKILYYESANPEKLIQIIEEKRRKIESIMPNLKRLKTQTPEKPELELYEGKEGIKTIYEDILNEKKDLSAISNTNYIFNISPFYVPHFIKQRVKKGIFIRLLNEKTKESVEMMKNRDKQEKRETRFLENLKDIKITEYIYGDKVAILGTDPKNPLGIIIKNIDFAKEQKLMFDIVWGIAQK
jgi:sugar-specific transcriptional regulator TrmB